MSKQRDDSSVPARTQQDDRSGYDGSERAFASDPVLREILALGPLRSDRSEHISELIGMDIDDYLDADEQAHKIEPDEEASRGWKAVMLAPDIEICRALLRGERVPWWVLNLKEAERFGLKRRHADDRYDLDDFNDVRK